MDSMVNMWWSMVDGCWSRVDGEHTEGRWSKQLWIFPNCIERAKKSEETCYSFTSIFAQNDFDSTSPWSMVNGQWWSMVDGRRLKWSIGALVVDGQWMVVDDQNMNSDNIQRVDGRWSMVDGEHGEHVMVDGWWLLVEGRGSMVDGEHTEGRWSS